MGSTEAAASESSLPVRAHFRRGPRGLDARWLTLDAVIGVPVPRPKHSREDRGTELPPRFMLEVDESEVRVLNDSGDAVLDAWPRGAVDACFDYLGGKELRLELRWRNSMRGGRIAADTSPETLALAELLVEDTRVRRGTTRDPAAALRRLVAETLPEDERIRRHKEWSSVAMLMQDGERPLLVAGAMRGLTSGIVVLTDRALLWWAGGRKDPVVLPRDQVQSAAATEPRTSEAELTVQPRAGKDIVLGLIEPPERGRELAHELNPRADALDELLAQERDGSAFLILRDRLEPVRPLFEESERVVTYAGATRGTKSGGLVVTDRRLLWVPQKGSPIDVDRAEIARAEVKRGLVLTRIQLDLRDGRQERLDAVEPRERAEAVVVALGFAVS